MITKIDYAGGKDAGTYTLTVGTNVYTGFKSLEEVTEKIKEIENDRDSNRSAAKDD